MRRFPPDLQHALAAEYVLGTLRGRARARFEALSRADKELQRVVRDWEAFLTPLALGLAPVTPPVRVWKAIQARIAPPGPAAAPSLWSSLAFWRGLGAALAVAVLALAVTLGPRPGPAPPSMVAVLSTPEQVARMIVEQHEGRLVVRPVKPWTPPAANDLELWVVPKDGKPRSLGVINPRGDQEIRMANLDAVMKEGFSIALSREPKGGSPTGVPTGPVLCSGVIARTQKA